MTHHVVQDAMGQQIALTRRQCDVIAGVVRGDSNIEIARHLHLAEHTVKNYLRVVYARCAIPNEGASQYSRRTRLAVLMHWQTPFDREGAIRL